MIKRLVFLIASSCLLTFSAEAQQSNLSTKSSKAADLYTKAQKYMMARDFDKALTALNEAVKKDPNFGEAYLKAAGLYRMTGNLPATFEAYKKGLSLIPVQAGLATEYYNFADMALNRGDYALGKQYYELFIQSNPKNTKALKYAQQQLKNIDFAVLAQKNPVAFKPVRMPAPINKFQLQYFPALTATKTHLVFTARNNDTPQADENLYVSVFQNNVWSEPVSIASNINSEFNEGTASISGDGKTLVFSSCNRPNSLGDCDLYISTRNGNTWSKPVNLGRQVNSAAWDSQPCLSADGRTLYFSSDRGQGSKGREDIWMSRQQEDGAWSVPENLGEPVNTSGSETAPFLHASGSTLYFSSNGHTGMGGADIFKTTLTGTAWTEPENLGYPLNTASNEASFFITPDNTKGYYSRLELEQSKKTASLFEFEVPAVWKSKETSTYTQGRVFDAQTKKPLGAYVQLYDLNTDERVQQVISDQEIGTYTVVLNEGKQYGMYVSADKYLLRSISFDYSSKKDFNPLTLDIYLDPVAKGASMVLNNLFFATGKYQLEKKSKTELNKIISFLATNTQVKIEISGHTDDVGNDTANQQLSDKRARSVYDYLLAQGVKKERILSVGYGETKPLQPNTSDENRQLNRRIELRVL
ncbi:OmpA family protein [Adhaeribacter pallidiroseus]|uniref:Outer membrane protein A n=1 Tax=Adhaeribacter pallidiroseus TaxID=2072847 RepID=A0A369QGB0_9BACT|nr:OmpA family protein [Adhaeribacter pallidiroseus]RDC63744.1 Outer membrane protein A [Adhaeribacter pallidiroseus]